MKFVDFFKGESLDGVVESCPQLTTIIDEVSKESFPVDLISSIANREQFHLISDSNTFTYPFVDSLHTATPDHRCFLAFGDKENSFYVIVHYSPIAIYLPKQNTFISLYKIYETTPEKLVGDLNELLEKITNPFELGESGDNKSLGLLIRSLRPFHYFFEVEYGLWNVVESRRLNVDDLCYFINTEESFFPFWEIDLFKSSVKEYSLPTDFNKDEYKNFVVVPPFLPVKYPGGGSLKAINEELANPDKLVVEKSLELCKTEDLYRDAVSELESCSVVLWFGICSEKRKWHEMIQTIVNISQVLVHRGENVGLVLDGMTGRISSEVEYKKHLTEYDNKVIDEIKALLPSNVKCVNLINATSWVKLGIASKVDFFMCHHMTDSIFISRFSGVDGVTHQSRIGTIAKSPQYRHPSISQIPAEWIDDDESNGRSPDTSYSIECDKVTDLFINQLFKVLNKKRGSV
ncbi:hypothetical protein [Alteromonas antoniana]|uniref:hypothetical protein n=1 Tax=Alteromonas antoniana TaxID=2803813 RepID=UPI001C46F81A|nr:hypothetical protein [Alteromonas antoniana]